ncbi:hypothetical protein BFP72_07730 [Reichenbachiella sp. 5M10]|nr:hypothetical protein BFP72_07730 [Reichenbachiella sp. 5M10]
MMTACGKYDAEQKPAYELTEPVTIQTDQNSAEYIVQIHQPGQWTLYHGTSPQLINWQSPITTIDSHKQKTYFIPKQPNRSFFALINTEQDTILASNRELILDEAVNFRDLGGIPTKTGQLTQWGKIYRSAELKDLSTDDLQQIREIQLKTIVDLRTNGEIENAPDTYPQDVDIQWKHLGLGSSLDDKQMDSLKQIMKDATPENFNGDSFMEDANRGFVDSSAEIKSIFDILLQNEGPLLFHCTAGKDRTGFTSAMILSALGVEKDVIMQEYLLSNYYRHEHNEATVEKAAKYFGINQEVLRQLMGVKAQYLEAAFVKIETEYGDVNRYLSDEVGLTTDNINQLKSMYLQ